MIEIYDIRNGKLKYSAYTLWQLCEMVVEDCAYHTGDGDNDIVRWIEEKSRELFKGTEKNEVPERLRKLAEFGESRGHRALASRMNLVLGEMAFGDGEHESAMEHFQKAVSLLPCNIKALHQLARGLSAVGQYDKAVEALRKANGIFPSEQAYLGLAEVLEKLKGPKELEKALGSLLRNYPRSIKGMHMLAQFYRRRRKTKAAARLAQRIVDLRPERGERSKPFFEEFADALIWSKYNYEARKVDKALEFLDEEQEINPDDWLSLLKAVMLYKLDKRLCREECCYELGKYFRGVSYDRAVVAKGLEQVVEVFGKDFSRGVVRFIENQFAKRPGCPRARLRRERRGSSPAGDRLSSEQGGYQKAGSGEDSQNVRKGAKFLECSFASAPHRS